MIDCKLSSQQVSGAWSLIRDAARIVVLTHMSPDGDAMGSALGFKHWLLSLSPEISVPKSVSVVVPNSFPDFLSWLPDAGSVLIFENDMERAGEVLAAADVVICTDFNEPKRIGSLGDRLMELRPKPVLLVDHHLHPADFADVVISYPDSPSASELVYRLIFQIQSQFSLSAPLSLDAATCIYTGMMTDTGNFSFNSNYPVMYEIVGQLVALGVNKDAVYNSVFNSYNADRMRLMGFCLYRKMQIFPEYHTALIYLSRKELYRFNFSPGDAEGLVNLPLQIKDVYYSCFMREDKVNPSEEGLANGSKTKVKISLRSQGNRPVNVFAHEIFGGGGHANASGGEHYGPLTEAVELFRENYKKYFLKD